MRWLPLRFMIGTEFSIFPTCRPELGKNLNADEAVALGAVYQGAGHSKMFRVKKFLVKEGTVFPIQVLAIV